MAAGAHGWTDGSRFTERERESWKINGGEAETGMSLLFFIIITERVAIEKI